DADAALALADEAEGDGLLLRVAGARQHLQGAVEVALHGRVEEADAGDLGQLDAAHAVGARQVEHGDLDDLLVLAGADGPALLLDADDDAGQGAALEAELALLAAGLLEDLGVGGVAVQVDGEVAQCLVAVVAVVADDADAAAVEVLEDEALEQVVDVAYGEG